MAGFSESEIEAAKKRVREMRNKADRFRNDDESEKAFNEINEVNNINESRGVENEEITDDESSQDSSFFIILALIMILSKEGADNKLILALLYLLL